MESEITSTRTIKKPSKEEFAHEVAMLAARAAESVAAEHLADPAAAASAVVDAYQAALAKLSPAVA